MYGCKRWLCVCVTALALLLCAVPTAMAAEMESPEMEKPPEIMETAETAEPFPEEPGEEAEAPLEATPAEAEPEENYLENPGFEEEDANMYSVDVKGEAEVNVVTEDEMGVPPASGDRILHFWTKAESEISVGQRVYLTPGKYTFSLYAMGMEGGSGELYVKYSAWETDLAVLGFLTSSESEWEYKELVFTLTEGGEVEAGLRVSCGAEVWSAFDDWRLADYVCPHANIVDVYTDSTCTVPGRHIATCQDCGQLLVDELSGEALVSHLLQYVPQVDATTSSSGCRGHWVCAGCGQSFLDEVSADPAAPEELVIPMLPEEPAVPEEPIAPLPPLEPEHPSFAETVPAPAPAAVVETTVLPDGTVVTTRREPSGVTASASVDPGGAATVDVTIPEELDTAVVVLPVETASASIVAVDEETGKIIICSAAVKDGFAVALAGSARLRLVDNSKSFSDVPEGSPYQEAVAFVSARELLGSTEEGLFAPEAGLSHEALALALQALGDGPDGGMDGDAPADAPLTWAEMAAMLCRCAGGDAREDALAWAVEAGILPAGLPDPEAPVTRGDGAAALMALCLWMVQQ